MENPTNQLIKMASDAELQRRWSVVREAMTERGIDYLIMQNSEEFLGGTLRWFTDWNADIGFPYTVVFPVDDDMTVINWGFPRPAPAQFPPSWFLRGIKNSWAAYYMPTWSYTKNYDGALAVESMSEKKDPVIGWVEKTMIPATFYEYVTQNLPRATFVDATDWIDELRVPKSAEEIGMIRQTAAMQDACFDHLKKVIQPGMRGYEVYAEVMYFCTKRACSRMNCMVNSTPLGTPVSPTVFHLAGRQIKEGDQVFVLIEGNGPGGQWTELARTFVVKAEPTPALSAAFAHSVEGQEVVTRHMVPGAHVRDIFNIAREFRAGYGYDPEPFDLAHGMGYSMVERPCFVPEEPMKLMANSNVAVHVGIDRVVGEDAAFGMCCDNFLIGPAGGAERIHRYPKELILV